MGNFIVLSKAHIIPLDISAAELDSIVGHATAYAKNLEEADVPTELHIWRGTTHAFVGVQPQTSIAKTVREEYLRAIKSAVEGN